MKNHIDTMIFHKRDLCLCALDTNSSCAKNVRRNEVSMKRLILVGMAAVLLLFAGCGKDNGDLQQGTSANAEEEVTRKTERPDEEFIWEEVPVHKFISAESSKPAGVSIPDGFEVNGAKDTEWYQEDIDSDGNKELILIYSVQSGEDTVDCIKAYDFEDEKEIQIFDTDGLNTTFTEDQKEKLDIIIKGWFEQEFEKVQHLSTEDFDDIVTTGFEFAVAECDGKTMINAAYKIEKATGIRKNDKIEVLLSFEDGEFIVYKAWYNSKYKSTNTFN